MSSLGSARCVFAEAVHLGEVGDELLFVLDVVDAELKFGFVAGVEVDLWFVGWSEGFVSGKGESMASFDPWACAWLGR